MRIAYLICILLIGFSSTQNIYQQNQINENGVSQTLPIDRAYLILHNKNCSSDTVLFGNKIICEYCDLIQIVTARLNQNITHIINTKYAYDLEVRLLSSNMSSLCTFKSYKFDEHGTYVLEIMQLTPTTGSCTIKQIGNLSNYWTPVIVGIIFVVLYTILVEIAQYLYNNGYFNRFRTHISQQRLINENIGNMTSSRENIQEEIPDEYGADTIAATNRMSKMSRISSTVRFDNRTDIKHALPKRLRGLDTFRGFALMVMIFVNYGGGGYWFFDHSIWNGLTLADLVFPWFTWMMGVSIVLSQRSMRKKNVSKRSILWKICRRTIILIFLGLTSDDDLTEAENSRIPGVLQRLAICYFFTAIIVLALDKKDSSGDSSRFSTGDDIQQPLRIELYQTVFQYWLEWICVLLSIFVWLLITFLLHAPGCPTGYLGPGGKHMHGKYENCTGGAAGYVDRKVLGLSHLYDEPTCKDIYHTKIPYDPEGILGNLTGVLLCYLGVQAAHIFVHCTSVRRTCIHWIVWGIICGTLALILSKGGHSDSWIPINKNLWSLTFVLSLSSLAFFNLTVLYLVVDVYQYFTATPFLWLGMNSIVIYMCHERFETSFPIQFKVGDTHAKQLAMHLYGAIFWSIIAGLMYYKRFFIAI